MGQLLHISSKLQVTLQAEIENLRQEEQESRRLQVVYKEKEEKCRTQIAVLNKFIAEFGGGPSNPAPARKSPRSPISSSAKALEIMKSIYPKSIKPGHLKSLLKDQDLKMGGDMLVRLRKSGKIEQLKSDDGGFTYRFIMDMGGKVTMVGGGR